MAQHVTTAIDGTGRRSVAEPWIPPVAVLNYRKFIAACVSGARPGARGVNNIVRWELHMG